MTYLVELLETACQTLFNLTAKPVLTRPDEQFGDYASNLALQLAGQIKQPPLKIAEQLKSYLDAQADDSLAKVEVVAPGFLNFYLADSALWQAAQAPLPQLLKGRRILMEYSCPNPFKELHTGHLYQTIVGDGLSVMLEKAGAKVFRANFGGDVGLHVAKCLWGARRALGGEHPEKLADILPEQQTSWLSQAYVAGAKAYQDNPSATAEIKQINNQVYEFHSQDDHASPMAQIYWECRDWSYNYFKQFYDDLGVKPFDKFYPESQVTPRGLATVEANRGAIFTESDGAVIFRGEDFGQHTRVFITSAGLPTYETKDLGVVLTEADDFSYDQRIIMTGNDQAEYMKVVFAALTQLDEALAAKQTHLTNGTVRFGDGQKMSSRLGNVLPATEVVRTVSQAVQAETDQQRRDIALGAIKYAFLKPRLGGDIAFDVSESVSLQGNSGPYLQYAYARARSILAKASSAAELPDPSFEAGERLLVRKISEFTEVVGQAVTDLSPHLICTYLYELAQVFNRFYEHNRVLDDPRQAVRLSLVNRYAATLHDGLQLLNIPTPEHL